MTFEKKFYVYVHRKSTDGTVFYVVKGSGKRAYSRSDRNSYWDRVVNKHGYTSHIVVSFNNENCAFSFERALIKLYGRENLCNHTDGGDGVSGLKHSEISKAKMSKSKKLILVSSDIISALKISRVGRTNSKEHNQAISNANKGRVMSKDQKDKISVSRTGKLKGIDNPSSDKNIYHFENINHGSFIGTSIGLRDKYNLTGGSVGRIVNGVRKSFKGWYLVR
jgi:hypothetical protein